MKVIIIGLVVNVSVNLLLAYLVYRETGVWTAIVVFCLSVEIWALNKRVNLRKLPK